MKKHFIWNIALEAKEEPLPPLLDERDMLRWEARYFFTEDEEILLHGLDEQFLKISNYTVKHREDCYVLLDDYSFNIKYRRQALLYKPVLQKTDLLLGYGKKINLKECPHDECLPGTANMTAGTLLTQIQQNPKEITVSKDALIYKFLSNPSIKLELARLVIPTRIDYSVCIEGRSKTLVTRLAKHLLKNRLSCDYVSFLKQTLRA